MRLHGNGSASELMIDLVHAASSGTTQRLLDGKSLVGTHVSLLMFMVCLLQSARGLDPRAISCATGKDSGCFSTACLHVFSQGNSLLRASRSRVLDSSGWTVVPCRNIISGVAGRCGVR